MNRKEKKILVHFEGEQNWCAMVRVMNFETVTVLEIVNVAMGKYNSVFHTELSANNLKIRFVHEFSGKPVIIENPATEEITSSDAEISVLLPDYDAWKARIEQERIKVSKKNRKEILALAERFLSEDFPGDARALLQKAEQIPAASRIERMYKRAFCEYEWIIERGFDFVDSTVTTDREIRIEAESFEMSDLAFGIERTTEELIKDIENSAQIDPERTRSDLLLLAKTHPKLAVSLVLRYPSLYNPCLPQICENEEAMSYFSSMLLSSKEIPRDLLALAEAFQSTGNIDMTLDLLLLYQKRDLDNDVVRLIVWLLLIDNRMGRLHVMLDTYFSRLNCKEIMNMNTKVFRLILKEVKLGVPVGRECQDPTNITLNDVCDLTQNEETIIPIIEITAIFCFMSGAFESFSALRNYLEPNIATILACEKIIGITHMFLFACSSYERLTDNRVMGDKIVAIGDETTMILAFQDAPDQGTVLAFPISALAIVNLTSPHGSTPNTLFWNRINEIEGYETLILCVGSNDLITTLPLWLMKDTKVTFREIFRTLINGFIGVIEKIQRKYPELEILVHSVFNTESVEPGITVMFNQMLSDMLPETVKFINITANADHLLAYSRQSGVKDTYSPDLRKFLAERKTVVKE